MPGKRQITTMCPMNCMPTQCGMTVEVEENRLISLKGDAQNPDSKGFLCMRGHATQEIFDNPRRLLTPLKRAGDRGADRWTPCSWEEAYQMIVDAIQRTRPERVGFWRGHGAGTTGFGGYALASRLSSLAGYQEWSSSIVCWAMGGYGLGLTGTLKTNTKHDMAANARTILLWGATLASQPDLAPHLVVARKRGAYVVQIDVRRTEASRHADEVLLVHPGTDAALALALAHVIVTEGWQDQPFVEQHTVGYAPFVDHLQQFTPEWAAEVTGLSAGQIRALANRYAKQTPATIVLGGSSMYKHTHGWEASRTISCLPALTSQYGIPGGGLGQRHGGSPESAGLNFFFLSLNDRIDPSAIIPSHMPTITTALQEGRVDVLLLLGSNMLNTFADNNEVAKGLECIGLIVAHDLFTNATSRRFADLLLPSTAWLEDLGLKETDTHIYLMEQALQPAGECRSLVTVMRELAGQLGYPEVFPWHDQEAFVDLMLSEQKTETGEPLTLAVLRKRGGYWPKNRLRHVAYQEHRFQSPSQKIEFWSDRAAEAGISPLPTFTPPAPADYPLRFCQGRTLTAFHSFFDEGQALPSLARANPAPQLWMHPLDAGQRQIQTGSTIHIANQRGQFQAEAFVTSDVLPGVVWMRDGWVGVNSLTNGAQIVPLAANDLVGIPGGQAAYDAWVEVKAGQFHSQ